MDERFKIEVDVHYSSIKTIDSGNGEVGVEVQIQSLLRRPVRILSLLFAHVFQRLLPRKGRATHPGRYEMSSATIKITYHLKPPTNVDGGDNATTKIHAFEIEPAASGSTAFYTALRTSLEQARNEVGDEMTAWRDIVGKAELVKEPKKVAEDEDEDEEANEEEG